MGLIGLVLQTISAVRNGVSIRDVKLGLGGGNNVTGEEFSSSGDDSPPLENDNVLAVAIEQTGRVAVVGYVDTQNAPLANNGERRLYSRDSSGEIRAVIWLRNDGSISLSNENGEMSIAEDGALSLQNENGAMSMDANGTINLNGVTIDPDGTMDINGVGISSSGAVDVPASLKVATKELAGHTHPQAPDSAGDVQQPTGPNL